MNYKDEKNQGIILICLLILSSCTKEIPSVQMVTRQGIAYEVNSTTPFTGTVVDYFSDGNVSQKASFKNGKEDGPWEYYSKNGQLINKLNYKDGMLNGLVERYHENGQLESKYPYRENMPEDGFYQAFLSNGEPADNGQYLDGNKHGPWEFYTCGYRSELDGKLYALTECRLEEKINYKDGKKHGRYEKYKSGGSVLINQNFINGKKHGLSETYFSNYDLNVVSKREFYVDDQLHGLSFSYSGSGALTGKTGFIEGKKYGLEVQYGNNEVWIEDEDTQLYDNEGIQFVHCYVDGEKIKSKTRYGRNSPNKTEIILINSGDYCLSDNQNQGIKEKYYSNGFLDARYEIHNGQEHGHWENFYKNGYLRISGIMHNGERTNEWKEYGESGQLITTASYINGVKDGLNESFYRNGKLLSKIYYKKDKIEASEFYNKQGRQLNNGIIEDHLESGQLIKKLEIKDGKINGLWEEYYHNGQPKEKIVFSEGYRNGFHRWYFETGKLERQQTYNKDKLDGLYETYFENGQLSEKAHYKDGKLDGPYEVYHENGQLQIKGNFKDEEVDGLHEIYFENGQLQIKANFKDGELIKIMENYDEEGVPQKN